MSFRIYLEITRAIVVLIVLFILIIKGKPIAVAKRRGYMLILTGFILIVFASFLDITDNFPSLNRFVVIGDTDMQAILEKVIGYLCGFICIAAGFWKWLPEVSELQQTQNDLSDSLKRERMLLDQVQNERNEFFTTLNSIGDGVISVDRDGRIMLLNPAAEKLTGWSQFNAIGEPIDEVFRILDDRSGDTLTVPVDDVLKSGKMIGPANHTKLISKKGEIVNISESYAPLKNQEGKIVGLVLIFRDITSEKELFAEKLKLQKLESVGVLASGIAHDFNNLLMGIRGNINLAVISGELSDNLLDLLKDADKASQRASDLTKQLLAFAKGGEPDIKVSAVHEIVKVAATFILTGTDIKCNFDIPDDLWRAQVDKGQISQVIENLILNARQAMPNGGEINIVMRNITREHASELYLDEGMYICIEISDNGVGISQDNLSKIFDPYFTTKNKGSGLGLAMSYSIINRHKGRITVESDENGKGTKFLIYLPADGIDGGVSSDDSADIPESKSDIIGKIMVMDDELLIRKLFSSMLVRLGYDVITAVNGEEALASYKKSMESGDRIDIVMLDLTIPGGMGGEETASKLLELDPDVNMIVVSGYENNPVLANFREYGFSAALPKPFGLNDLEQALKVAHPVAS